MTVQSEAAIQQLYANSKAIKEAEQRRCEAQNVESAARTEQARLERDPELLAVDAQNQHRDAHARLRSNSPEAAALGTRSRYADELVGAGQDDEPWTAAELQELIDEADPDVIEALRLPK